MPIAQDPSQSWSWLEPFIVTCRGEKLAGKTWMGKASGRNSWEIFRGIGWYWMGKAAGTTGAMAREGITGGESSKNFLIESFEIGDWFEIWGHQSTHIWHPIWAVRPGFWAKAAWFRHKTWLISSWMTWPLNPLLSSMIIWLVVWLPFFNFPIYWECHHPNWLSYFSEGWPNHQPVIWGHALVASFVLQGHGINAELLQVRRQRVGRKKVVQHHKKYTQFA